MTTRAKSLVHDGYSKYHAKQTVVDGIKFPSKKEAARYGELKLRERAGEIRSLRVHSPRYSFKHNGVIICDYVPDFVYDELENGAWKPVVEDVKGVLTPVYRIKRNLMLAFYGVVVKET